jgi:hypothetical protein
MKKTWFLLCFTAGLLIVPEVFAQTDPLNGMSLNGTTGLYAVPSGRIGWDEKADVGIDFGSSYNFFSQNPIAKVGLSLYNWVEISGAIDFQPKIHDTTNTDGILGIKLQLPTPTTGVAIGGNVQFLSHLDKQTAAGQIYAAISYRGYFFSWPADTSLALGYTILEGGNKNIDFGMGFDMTLIPKVLGNFVHLVVDFSNFSYSHQALGVSAWNRGSLNTGLRINISAAPALNSFKFVFDVILLDVLDSDRTIGMGFSFGLPLK